MNKQQSSNSSQRKYFLIIGIFIFISCGTSRTNIFKEDGDALLYIHNTDSFRPLSHNGKSYHPTGFEIRLPKKIQDFDLYSTDCYFKFPEDQYITIKNNMLEDTVIYDSIYFDREKEVINWSYGATLHSNHKYKVNENAKNVMIKKGTFIIYLMNIKDENIEEYIRLVKSLKIYDNNGKAGNISD